MNNFLVYNEIPTVDALPKYIESPFDIIRIKDEDKVFSPNNNKILLEFDKNIDSQQQRKIIIGSCKLIDPKNEKPTNYEINMPVFNF